MTNQEVHQKMLRWATWASRGGLVAGLWYARCSLFSSHGGGLPPDATLDDEAVAVQRALIDLQPRHLLDAVNEFYLGKGTREQQARALGVSLATFKRHVAHAQERIGVLLKQQSDAKDGQIVKFSCSFRKKTA